MLKNQPFYSEETKSVKKRINKLVISRFYLLLFFHKKPKELTNKQLSEAKVVKD